MWFGGHEGWALLFSLFEVSDFLWVITVQHRAFNSPYQLLQLPFDWMDLFQFFSIFLFLILHGCYCFISSLAFLGHCSLSILTFIKVLMTKYWWPLFIFLLLLRGRVVWFLSCSVLQYQRVHRMGNQTPFLLQRWRCSFSTLSYRVSGFSVWIIGSLEKRWRETSSWSFPSLTKIMYHYTIEGVLLQSQQFEESLTSWAWLTWISKLYKRKWKSYH